MDFAYGKPETAIKPKASVVKVHVEIIPPYPP